MKFKEITGITGKYPGTAAVAGAEDPHVLTAVSDALKAGIKFFLTGRKDRIIEIAEKNAIDISDAGIIEPGGSEIESAGNFENAVCLLAARICSEGTAGVLMKGLVSTASFTRAVLNKEIGLTPEGNLLSHVGLFSDPRYSENKEGFTGNGSSVMTEQPEIFLVTDAAINIQPDLETKKKIIANAVKTARSIGIEKPNIALLAPVEKINSKIQSTLDAAELAQWVNSGVLGNAAAEGPFALDVAASAEAAEIKGIKGSVPGHTDIYVVPDLDAGNILYKALKIFAGADAAGILAGADVPVVLTSRSDSENVKKASLGFALAAAAGLTEN